MVQKKGITEEYDEETKQVLEDYLWQKAWDEYTRLPYSFLHSASYMIFATINFHNL